MEKRRKKNSIYSKDFIFNVLFDYYSSEVSKSFIIRKYGISHGNLYGWLKKYDLEGKELMETNLSKNYLVVGIKRKEEYIIPTANTVLNLDDELLLMRKNED